MERTEELIVSASGIRGIAGAALTPEVAARYGAAFAAYLGEERLGSPGDHVVVGRDTRSSGPALLEAVSRGLRSGGCAVTEVGVAPTPTILLATQDDARARGAAIVTASHNPAPWNGLKLAGPEGRFLEPEAGRRVQEIYEGGRPESREEERGARAPPLTGAVEHHLERILALPLLDPAVVAKRGFRVGLDCVHGAGAVALPTLLERLGCRVVGVGLEADGRFPRNPEPTPENLEALGVLVRREGAELGMAVDPDGDRLALVDGRGLAVGEDWTLALAVELVLSRVAGPVVTNLSTSRCVQDAAERAGQPLHRAPVGEANVARRMLEVDAPIGGEGNGGVMLRSLHLTRDAPLAAALVLQLLAEREVELRELLGIWPAYRMVKRKVARPAAGLDAVYTRLLREAVGSPRIDRQDGLRLDWPGGRWVHLRPSGTEPIVRLVAEAPEAEEAERLAAWAGEVLERCAGS
ncbi:MAG: phosphoglucosamine mutase [Gemmatimonadota bacterium]